MKSLSLACVVFCFSSWRDKVLSRGICVQFISWSFQIFISTPVPAEPDKLAAPAEVKLTRECEQDKISTGGGADGKSGCTTQEAAPPRWRPRFDTGLASKEGANGLRTRWLLGCTPTGG